MWVLKTGLVYKLGGFYISPCVRVMGERLDDVDHKESIGPYLLTDLTLGYTAKKMLNTDEIIHIFMRIVIIPL